ncbi:MAG: hypothetical protein ABJB47_12705, partial [Actinomycetota bacterium]
MPRESHQPVSVLPASRAARGELSAVSVLADETSPDLLPGGIGEPGGLGGPELPRPGGPEGPGGGELAPAAELPPAGDPRRELALAREIRAREMVAGKRPADIAAIIRAECAPDFCTTWIRAYRLALGIALADVVAQVRAWYVAEGRKPPRFSETLLSAYESGQKRPGPEYLHYLCAVYRADPRDLGYDGGCFCGRPHGDQGGSPGQAGPVGQAGPAEPGPGGAALARLPSVLASMPSQRPGTSAQRHDGLLAPRTPGDTGGLGAAGGGAGQDGAGSAGVSPEAVSPEAVSPEAVSPEAASPEAASPADASQSDVLRRMLLRLQANSAEPADGQFFGAVEHVRRDLDEALLRRSVSVSMLDQWEEAAAGYGARYMSVPPLRLLCDVLLDLADVRRMCAQRQPIDSAERLCRLAAQLAGLVGLIMIDLGDQRLARSYFRTARTAADE